MVPVELRSLFGNRVFGCDICQSVCPWNKKSRSRETFFAQYAQTDLANLSLITGLAMNNQSFKQKYGGTPVLRAKRRGFLRNICIALGNSGLQAAVPGLAACLEGESEYIIRAHAAWALGRLKNELSTRALKHALDYELDPIVKNEIDSALA